MYALRANETTATSIGKLPSELQTENFHEHRLSSMLSRLDTIISNRSLNAIFQPIIDLEKAVIIGY